MKRPSGKEKSGLDKKFQKVITTPSGFGLFVAIHDFIEHIELNPVLAVGLSDRIKANKELDIAGKYEYLKRIYQGLEDIESKSDADFGHSRYAAILELNKIKNNEATESNSFWKKREASRKLAAIIYERLSAYIATA